MKGEVIVEIVANTMLCIGAAMIGGLIVKNDNKKSRDSGNEALQDVNLTLRNQLIKSWNENEQLKTKLEGRA